MNDVGQLTV